MVAEAYLGDAQVRQFLETHNPAALKEIKARLAEAIHRNLWHPRKNSLHALLED
jgi:cobaltochelatase CobN